jgi:hypothetical protein
MCWGGIGRTFCLSTVLQLLQIRHISLFSCIRKLNQKQVRPSYSCACRPIGNVIRYIKNLCFHAPESFSGYPSSGPCFCFTLQYHHNLRNISRQWNLNLYWLFVPTSLVNSAYNLFKCDNCFAPFQIYISSFLKLVSLVSNLSRFVPRPIY